MSSPPPRCISLAFSSSAVIPEGIFFDVILVNRSPRQVYVKNAYDSPSSLLRRSSARFYPTELGRTTPRWNFRFDYTQIWLIASQAKKFPLIESFPSCDGTPESIASPSVLRTPHRIVCTH